MISSPNLTFTVATNTLTANYFSGNGSAITSLTGANVSGNVTSAVQSHYANIANSVTFTNVSGTPTTITGYGITDAYSNTNTAAYLPTYTGNLTAGNINLSYTTTSIANLGNAVVANYFSGDVSNVTGLTLTSTNFTDVALTSPTSGQLLGYNGVYWTNVIGGSVSAGPSVNFWLTTPVVNAVTANNAIQLDTLGSSPNTSTQQYITTVVNTTTAIVGGFVSAALGRTIFDAGNWSFSLYANISATGGTTTISPSVHQVTTSAAIVTITGSGTSRTATASSGTPFASAVVSASVPLSSYLQTPLGLFRITAKASSTVVTITTLSGYTNETSATASLWIPLFSAGSISVTSTTLALKSFSTSQTSYSVTTATAFGVLVSATTSSNKTINLAVNGSTNVSSITTPFGILHNSIPGLQGGQADQYYHLTNSEYAGTGSGVFARSESPTFGNINISGNASFTGANVSLGANSNVKITGGTTGTVLSTDGTGNLSWITAAAVVLSGASSVVGNVITLGSPTVAVDTAPGNLTTPGVVSTWTTDTKVTDAIDDLNEVMENVRNLTYVKTPAFTANVTAAGQGTYIGLTIPTTPTATYGTPNQWDINWGDGNYSNNVSSLSPIPSHQYNTNVGSPYAVTVRAYNTTGVGTGSEGSLTKSAYIIIYTANPVVSFGLYRASTGGTALTGITLYVSEGETFYLENTTTNTSSATVTYTINWGDGNTDTITSDSVAGGVGGGRKSHTYASGQNSGTSTKTITLTITSHSTATPSYIATGPNSTASIKIYNPSIAAPNGLSSKTVTFQTSVGTSPYLAANYANNAGAAVTTTAGSSISRVTSGTPVETVVMPTYAYNADSGYLRAVVNNTEDGNISLTTGSQAGTNASLVLSAESDYNLLDATGTTTTFGLSIYSPSLYKGFTAKVSKTNSALTAGLNTFKLSHSSTGNTNIVEFVKDDVTSVPTVDVSTATLSSATNGTYRYISGVPYYNTGSPTITLAGTKVYNWIGQTYQNTTTPFQIEPGTNDESTSGSVVASQTRTYTQIDGASTFLSVGIPKANTGNTSSNQYTLGSVTVNITSSSVASVQTVKFLLTNVNGSSAYAAHTKKIQVFTSTPSGFVEDSITCAIGGDNTVAKRIVLTGTGPTRSYTGSGTTNFYSTAAWTGAQTVAGTDSAIVRWNTLKWFNTDLSGYLPAGPDLSTGRSGTQYFFGAFTRVSKSGFSVTISGKISGLKFAIPGVTESQTYATNGWLDATVAYFGAGAAGANDSGCADGTTVPTGSTISGTTYKITFGTLSTSSSGNWSNQVLFSIALASGDSITSWSFS